MVRRLGRKRIKGLITKEEDPETAVTLYLKGELKAEEANSHDTHDHAHTH
jgi:hypothetical protein